MSWFGLVVESMAFHIRNRGFIALYLRKVGGGCSFSLAKGP